MISHRNLLYVCRVKFKFGEYVGISRVDEIDKDAMLAHLSVPMPNDWDHEDKRRLNLEECQHKFATRLAQYWRKRPAIIDTHRFDDEPEFADVTPHPLRAFAEEARMRGCFVIPAVPLRASGSLTIAAKETIRRHEHGVVIKLRLEHLDDPNLLSHIDTLLGALGVGPNQAMLCIDLGDIQLDNPGEIAEAFVHQLAVVPHLNDWRHVYVSVGAFSANLSKMAFGATKEVPRNDWLFYEAVTQHPDLPRRVVYSDFGIEAPNFAQAPTNARASAHLRHTNLFSWSVCKGQSIRRMGYAAIKAAADAVVKLGDFRGADYSKGAEFFQAASDGKVTGSPSTWRAAGVAHHIAVVLDQLRSKFGITVPRVVETTEPHPDLFDETIS